MKRTATVEEILNLDPAARAWLIIELREAPMFMCATAGDLCRILDDAVWYYSDVLFRAGILYEIAQVPDPSIPEPKWWERIRSWFRKHEIDKPHPQASQYAWVAKHEEQQPE